MSWIFSVVRVVHILSCFFLILVVLLQAGKGAGIGSAFGGAGSAVFGGRGAGGFISKVTWVMAGVFMFTSVSLAWRSTQRGSAALQRESKPVSPEKLLLSDEVIEDDAPDVGIGAEDATPLDELIDVPVDERETEEEEDGFPGELMDEEDSADVPEDAAEGGPPEEEPLDETGDDDSTEIEPSKKPARPQPSPAPARKQTPRAEPSELEMEPPRPSTSSDEPRAEPEKAPVRVEPDTEGSE